MYEVKVTCIFKGTVAIPENFTETIRYPSLQKAIARAIGMRRDYRIEFGVFDISVWSIVGKGVIYQVRLPQ